MGRGGVYRVPTQLLGRGPWTAKRARKALQGPGVVVHGARANEAAGTVRTTLRARSVPPCGPSLSFPLKCRLWAKGARFHDISWKVSQNGQVSPKSHEKASHSPYSQNGLEKSPLEILRIPFPRAFSGKELMVPFCRYPGLYCQNDEVSPLCTPVCHAKGAVRYPQPTRSKLLLGRSPHLTLARYSQRTRF